MYKNHEGQVGTEVHEVENGMDPRELQEYKNDLVDECEQAFMPAFVLTEEQTIDIVKQLVEKLSIELNPKL